MKRCLTMFFWKLPLLSALIVCGCAGAPDLTTRQHQAATMAPVSHIGLSIRTQNFDLFSYVPKELAPLGQLTVFIEGDGFAWKTRHEPSDDPTPITQTVLSLFAASGRSNTAYLARPCQFVGARSRNCSSDIWTSARYSERVVAALDEAVTALSTRHNAPQITLVGYSGGGTLAALLAARRSDVNAFVTIAAPLDVDAFTEHHNVSPMNSSLNPLDFVEYLTHIPQIHVFGQDDTVVPVSLVESYLRALPDKQCVQVKVASADHWTGWADISPKLGNLIPTCKAPTQ